MASRNKKRFIFNSNESQVQFNSNFECGNLGEVTQLDNQTYSIWGQPDTYKTTKSFLYFSVRGFPIGSRIRFRLVNIFYTAESKKAETSYQLCVKRGDGEWQRMLEATTLEMAEDKQLVLSFSWTFWMNETYEFAFNYPYSYEREERYFELLRQQFENDKEIYYQDQSPAVSRQSRNIRLITISNKTERPIYSKPVIFITGRVHPSQTPSSYVVQGIINFLLKKSDLRSHILRQTFTIMVIPMLNPDGVAMGNFRYDDLGQNLNRYYLQPTPSSQPSILAAHNIIAQVPDRLTFYFDLHAHHSPKGCFIYGNFFDDFVKQVQARVFCKVMSINNSDFEYSSCNHSLMHMTSKDKQDVLSKKGCGRVFAYKEAGIVHSYTVECGYYKGQLNEKVQDSNMDYVEDGRRYTVTENTNCDRIYTQANYREIGRDLMISVLDVLAINPYTKIANSEYKEMELLRKAISTEVFYTENRFRRVDSSVIQKIKNINLLTNLMYAQWQLNLQLPATAQNQQNSQSKKGDEVRQFRAQTQIKQNKELIFRKHSKKAIRENSAQQFFLTKKNNLNVEVISIRNEQLSNYRQPRLTYSPALCSIKNSLCQPFKMLPSHSRTQIKATIQTQRQRQSIQMKPRKSMIRTIQRKTIKTQISPQKQRLQTQLQTISAHKKSLNFEFRLQSQQQVRKTIIFGDNGIIRAYQSAKKRAMNRRLRQYNSRQLCQLPRLQNLLEVKSRIVQQCRLEYIPGAKYK